jgi:Ca2+-binding RTX toxin-like protein
MGSDGLWTYSLLNGDPDTNALNDSDHKTETFAVQSADGTSHNVVVTVNGHSDFTYVAPTVFTGTGDPNDNDNAVVSGSNSQTGTSASETFTGSANNDKIAGGAGDDTINAGDGNDNQLYGQAGNDTINGGIGADNIYGGSGSDFLYGYQAPAASSSIQDGADDLYGGSGNDQIFGQNSNDLIVGGFGADTLTGGTGADTFRYLDVRDTGDTIADFSQVQGDKIDLTALYTGSVNGGVLTFDDVLATAGGVAEGHVGYAYDAGTNVTTVYVGVNAAYGADLEIKLNGNIDLAAGDFLL